MTAFSFSRAAAPLDLEREPLRVSLSPQIQFNIPGRSQAQNFAALEYAQGYLKKLYPYNSESCFPDIFLSRVIARNGGTDLLTKKALIEAINGKVTRPDTVYVTFPTYQEARRDPDLLRRAVLYVSDRLQHSTLFNKLSGAEGTPTAQGGRGIIRMKWSNECFEVCSTDTKFLEGVRKTLKFESVSRTNFVRVGCSSVDSLEKVLARVLPLSPGIRALEDEIPIARLGNKSWEIRNLMLDDGQGPQLAAHYTKLGTNDLVANISRGGVGAKPREVVASVISEAHPGLSAAESEALVDKFLNQVEEVSKRTTRIVSASIRDRLMAHVDGVDPKELYVRAIAIDVTGAWELGDSSIELRPIVIEPQYPTFGMTALIRLDPAAYKKYAQRRQPIEAAGREYLRQALSGS